MTRPDPRGVPARPTLFGAAPAIRPTRSERAAVELRMLSRSDRPTRGAEAAWPSRLGRILGGAALLVAAGGALWLRPTGAPQPSTPNSPVPAAVVPARSPQPLPAAAVIETVAPARRLASTASDPPRPAVVSTTRQARHASNAPTGHRATPHAVSADLGHPPADADVDLLAAMFTRLQAAEAASAGAPKKRLRGEPDDDSRAAAR